MVGVFTLITMLVGFAFVYWVARIDERGSLVDLEILIEGSVTGLTKGSPVLFNGINVGSVRRLTIATNAPKFVVARVKVNAETPIRKDTRASIGMQGFTGGAFIQLEGGSSEGVNILSLANQEEGIIPRINADPAALSDIMARVNEIAARTEKVMGVVEGFLDENRDSLSKTVANAEKFSDALAANSDGVKTFLSEVSAMGKTISGLSEKLDGTIVQIEKIVEAVEPESVRKSIANLEQFSETLKSSRDDIKKVIGSISDAAGEFNKFSEGINQTLGKVDKLVASVDSAKVGTAIDDISAVAANAKEILAVVETKNLAKTLDDINQIAADAKGVVAAIKPAKVEKIVDDLTKTIDQASGFISKIDVAKVNSTLDNLDVAAKGATTIVEDISAVTGKIKDRGGDVNQIITDTKELTAKLNTASTRVDGILEKVDGMLGGGNGKGLMVEARETLAQFRKLAKNLDVRIAEITKGISRFSNRGLRDAEVLIGDAKRAINRIDRVISNFENNPGSFISGSGSGGIRQVSGGRPRR